MGQRVDRTSQRAIGRDEIDKRSRRATVVISVPSLDSHSNRSDSCF